MGCAEVNGKLEMVCGAMFWVVATVLIGAVVLWPRPCHGVWDCPVVSAVGHNVLFDGGQWRDNVVILYNPTPPTTFMNGMGISE